MLFLRNALVPLACLPSELATSSGIPEPAIEPARRCDLTIERGTINAVAAVGTSVPPEGATVKDLGGALTFPGLLDAHVHLDKAHTWHRAPNRSGTFEEAIEVLGADKENWTEDDVYRRADFALRCAYAHGTRAVRTHIDTWNPSHETSHAVMARLREEWAGRITLQTVSLCGVEQYPGPDGEKLADLPVKHGASALGGMPRMNPDLPKQLDALMRFASERGVGLDLHVDESGDPQAECLRAVAEAVLRNEFAQPVTCGHCCSLAVQAPVMRKSTLALVREAGLHIIALPLCNLYLQDRRAHATPLWRGLTLVHEFIEQGTVLACASDNVRDAFYAYGDLDMAEVFVQSVRIGHLDSRLQLAPAIATTAPAALMGLPGHGRIAPGAEGGLTVFEATSFSELLSRPAGPRRILEGEALVTPPVPDYAELRAG